MKRIIFLILFVGISVFRAFGQELTYENFVHPPVNYYSVPFWSLNDKLEPDEIKRQLKAFKDGGFGGAYLHSRTGLLTEYLGDVWWEAMDAGVQACGELGIEAWFYDEDQWPSGFAGGIVPKMSEDYHGRILFRLPMNEVLPQNAKVLTEKGKYKYVEYKLKMGDPRFNGTCWVDLMNPETVKAFIEVSYKPYAQRCKEKYGKVAQGIFTDEPQFTSNRDRIQNKGHLMYSPYVIEAFKKDHGYNFLDSIEYLFEDTGNYQALRLHYFRTISQLFEESFTKQISKYCADNNIIWTGHYMGEDNFGSVQYFIGNAMMHYRHMQRPGIDFLGLNIKGGINIAKSMTSVANQYGKGRRLSELFGISGQNMNFEDRKWISDWHTLMGVNHFCPHLSLYSMKGCRKRDYPPTFSPQQPYWKYNKLIEDYMARVCYLTSQGEFAPEFLVIHPMESQYIEKNWGDMKGNQQRYHNFYKVIKTLQNTHRDYDLGDEQIMSEIAKVNGQAVTIGEMEYASVILPYMCEIRKSTLDLLLKLSQNGGTVLVMGEFPQYIDGKVDEKAIEELKNNSVFISTDELSLAITKHVKPIIRISGEHNDNIWTHRRAINGGTLVQLGNISRFNKVDFHLKIEGDMENPVVWDPATGKCLKAQVEKEGIHLQLSPAQSLIITTGGASSSATISGNSQILSKEQQIIELSDTWTVNRLSPNTLTLDFASYSIDNGKTFSKPEPVIGIHERFTKQQYDGPLQLKFYIEVKEKPNDCQLVLEQPELFTIKVNSRDVKFKDNGFYCDNTFRKTNIARHIKKGTNEILLSLEYKAPIPGSNDQYERYGTEIESIYLIGGFSVKTSGAISSTFETQRNKNGELPEMPVFAMKDFYIGNEKETIVSNLVKEGYPFFNGEFQLIQNFTIDKKVSDKSYFIRFPKTEAIVVIAELNGTELPPVAWSPWEIDITGSIRQGDNALKITLVNSLRNTLGPHHSIERELIRVGPGSFSGQSDWTSRVKGEPDWYDVRLNGKAKKWTDNYNFIPFGFLEPPVILARE